MSIAVPDKGVLTVIASHYGSDSRKLRDAWPFFYRKCAGTFEAVFGHQFWLRKDQMEPPELP
jgi:hypothetical protein